MQIEALKNIIKQTGCIQFAFFRRKEKIVEEIFPIINDYKFFISLYSI